MNQNNLNSWGERRQWLSELYQREFPALKLYVVHLINNEHEAEDIIGQSFQKLLQQIDSSPGDFPAPANLKALLVTIVRNDTYSWRRKQQPQKSTDELLQEIADDHLPVSLFEKHDLLLHILPLINKLPGQLQQVAHLCWVEGCPLDEIAQRMGMDKAAVSVYKTRALNKLRSMVLGRQQSLKPGEILLLLHWLYALA